ncbi:hypothetical protein NDU88_004378 [Pleurodeles waltl]|uniref:Uncharacterized protein n=1 Tax=Pleurodeles waltl TaxID=8319 RepID=A0AAV7VG40_PLEWA|nr:hypothetical protein NDU88_004378 [Pleurodeles waltl]
MRSRAFPKQQFSSGGRKAAGVTILVSRSFKGRVGDKVAEASTAAAGDGAQNYTHEDGGPRVWRQLSAAQLQLAGLYLDRAEYTGLRLRHSSYVGGNRCGRLLVERLRAQHQKVEVASIRLPGGPVVTSDAQIALAFRDFYWDLYSAQRADPGPSLHYLEQACMAKLTPEEATPLEAPICLEEVISAIA